MVMVALHAIIRQVLLCLLQTNHLTHYILRKVSSRLAVLQEASCGCAGIFSAPVALQLYAQLFEDAGQLEQLEAFASHSGADFYGLPRNQGTLQLVRRPMQVPKQYAYDSTCVVPICAGQALNWDIASP